MKARVRILSYREEKASIGPVEFTSFRVVSDRILEEPVELGEDVEGMLERMARELGGGDYVEAIAETKNGVVRVGVSRREGESQQGSLLLFYRPSKLLKIGIVPEASKGAMSGLVDIEGRLGSGELGGFSGESTAGIGGGPSEDDILWYTPPDMLYIFEGQIVLREPCEVVIFLTEDGEKIYTGSGETQERRAVRRAKREGRKARKRRRK